MSHHGESFFLGNEDGEIVEQRYRITKAVAEESSRLANLYNLVSTAAGSGAGGGGSDLGGNVAHRRVKALQRPTNPFLQPSAEETSTVVAPSASSPQRVIAVRPRTKLEADRMATIPQRQKANVIKEQSVMGRTFSGPGFNCDPAEVTFDNFTVGRLMTLTVKLTNVSLSTNGFRVLTLPGAIIDTVDVKYVPQTALPAGMNATLTIHFTPKANVDIHSKIPILTQTGPLDVPFHARIKRPVIHLSTDVLEFHAVVIGESRTLSLSVRNDGTLGTTFTMHGDIWDRLLEYHLMPEAKPPTTTAVDSNTNATTTTTASTAAAGREAAAAPTWSVGQQQPHDVVVAPTTTTSSSRKQQRYLLMTPNEKAKSGGSVSLAPGQCVTFSLTFQPLEVMALDTSLFLSFDDAAAAAHHGIAERCVLIRGRSVDIPVFIESNATMNLGCCFIGTMYRDAFTVKNTTRAAVKIEPQVPPALKGLLEFVPAFGFCQPDGAKLTFQTRFTPTRGGLRTLRRALEVTKVTETTAGSLTPTKRNALQSVELRPSKYASLFHSGPDDEKKDEAATSPLRLRHDANEGVLHGMGSTTGEDSEVPSPTHHDSIQRVDDDDDDAARAEDGGGGGTSRGARAAAGRPSTAGSSRSSASSATGGGPSTYDLDFRASIPVLVHGQSMPPILDIIASTTKRKLSFQPPQLNFGPMLPNEGLTRRIVLFNDSLLFRTVGFTRVPSNVSITPSMPSLRLAPKEKLELRVSVKPPTAAAEGISQASKFSQTLTLLTEDDECVQVPISGTLRSSALCFSPPAVLLPRCALHDSVKATVVLKNTTSELQRYCFKSWTWRYGITLSPTSGELPPGGSVAIEVRFDAHPSLVEPLVVPPPLDEAAELAAALGGTTPEPDAGHALRPGSRNDGKSATAAAPAAPPAKKKSKADEEAERLEKIRVDEQKKKWLLERQQERQKMLEEMATLVPWEVSAAGGASSAPSDERHPRKGQRGGATAKGDGEGDALEEWSRHRTVLLPCFVQGWAGKAVFLSIRTSVVAAAVIAGPPAAAGSATTKQQGNKFTKPSTATPSTGEVLSVGFAVDFGDRAALSSTDQTFSLENISRRRVSLSILPLGPDGPFSISRPPAAALEPGQSCDVTMRFCPRLEAFYEDVVTIVTDAGHNVLVTTSGRALPTALSVSFEKPTTLAAVQGPTAGVATAAAKPAVGAGGKAPSVPSPAAVTSAATSSPQKTAVSVSPSSFFSFGHCLIGDVIDHPIYFTNHSAFPMSVTVSIDPSSSPCSGTEHPAATIAGASAAATGSGQPLVFRNPNGTLAFSVTPQWFMVPAFGRIDAVMAFAPGAVGEFRCTAIAQFGGQGTRRDVTFHGHGCDQGVYVVMPKTSSPPPTAAAAIAVSTSSDLVVAAAAPFMLAANDGGSAAGAAALSVDSSSSFFFLPAGIDPLAVARDPFAVLGDGVPTAGSSSQFPLIVEFTCRLPPSASGASPTPEPPSGAATRSSLATPPGGSRQSPPPPPTSSMPTTTMTTCSHVVTVGNVRNSANGEFTLDPITDADAKLGWKADVSKGTVASGAKQSITLTFTPTPLLQESLPLPGVAIVTSVALKLSLKGGTPVTDSVQHLLLKGRLLR